jgi:hypothetical protein
VTRVLSHFEVQVSENDTVGLVKQKVQELLGCVVQSLFDEDIELEPDHATLMDLGVDSSTVITVQPRNPPDGVGSPRSFEASILIAASVTGTGSAKRLNVTVTEGDRIETIKSMVLELEGLDVAISLWYDGTELSDDMTLRDYLIDETDVIEARAS